MKYEGNKDKVPVHVRMDPFVIAALDFYAKKARLTRSEVILACIQKALPSGLVPVRAITSNRRYWRTDWTEEVLKVLRSTKNRAEFEAS